MKAAMKTQLSTAIVGAFLICAGLVPVAPVSATETSRIRMNIVAFSSPGTPWHDAWLTMAKNLDACCADALDVRLLVQAEVGSEEVLLPMLRRGRGQFGGFSLGGAANTVRELGVIISPFLFSSTQELDWIMDNVLFDFFQRKFAEKGLVFLRWTEVGWLNVYATYPIRVPDDLRADRKMRSQTSEASQTFIRSIGGDLIQLPFADVIPALQTGLIIGGESSAVLYAFAGLASEGRYFTRTRHAFDTGIIAANKTWYDTLSPHLQQALIDAYPTTEDTRAEVRSLSRSAIRSLEQKGQITVIDLSEAERDEWRRATRGNTEQIIRAVGGEAQIVYDLILDGKKAFAALGASPTGAEN